MGVYIDKMQMPENCNQCNLIYLIEDETFCPFFADNIDFWIKTKRRHEDCPLIGD